PRTPECLRAPRAPRPRRARRSRDGCHPLRHGPPGASGSAVTLRGRAAADRRRSRRLRRLRRRLRPALRAARTSRAENGSSRRRLVRLDRDEALFAARAEGDLAVAHREDRVVLADPGSRAGAEARAALAEEDHPRRHVLAGEELHAEHLRLGVAAVPRRAESLLVCHSYFSSSADSNAASAPLRALPEPSCSSAASTCSRLQLPAASVSCAI